MKAAVYKGNQRIDVEEIPTPTPGPGQVIVKVKYCGICGTDVHAYLYDVFPAGAVMGHEYCGTIVEVGPSVSGWKEGDRVIGGGGMPPPGKEHPSLKNPRYSITGSTCRPLGAYAEYILMEQWAPVSIPEGVSDEEAALCEPCAVAVHAIRISQMKLGDSVAIIGAGPIGLLCLQVAKAAGAGTVFVSEPASTRAEAALSLGAAAVIDPSKDDVVSEIVSLTDGTGPAVVFECAAAKSTLDQALRMVRTGGQVVLVALAWEPTPVLPVEWMAREIRLQTSFNSIPEDFQIALDLIKSGKVTMQPLLSEASFIPLEEIKQSLDDLITPTTQVKVVVKL